MLVGTQNVLIITSLEGQLGFMRMLGDGRDFGIKITYAIQPSPDVLAQAIILGGDFIGNDSVRRKI